MNNIFDLLYEVPDIDDRLEPEFNIDPYWNLEYDVFSNCIDQGEL